MISPQRQKGPPKSTRNSDTISAWMLTEWYIDGHPPRCGWFRRQHIVQTYESISSSSQRNYPLKDRKDRQKARATATT